MAIGLVGKKPGIRLISGSVHYGMKSKEEKNAMYHLDKVTVPRTTAEKILWPFYSQSRGLIVIGQKAVIPVTPTKKKGGRKKVVVTK